MIRSTTGDRELASYAGSGTYRHLDDMIREAEKAEPHLRRSLYLSYERSARKAVALAADSPGNEPNDIGRRRQADAELFHRLALVAQQACGCGECPDEPTDDG